MTKKASTKKARAGFSLLELLVAMSIFSVISVGIIALLSRVSGFTQSGASKTETLDALQTFSQSLDRDLQSIHAMPASDTGPTDVRLWSDVARSDVDGDGKEDATIRRLAFVRQIPGEAAAELTRLAGTNVAAKGVLDQRDDNVEASKGDLRATGGLMEIFWVAVPDSTEDLARMTLYRGFRAPIGGPDSLLPDRPADDTRAELAEKGPLHLKRIREVATPVLSGVLYFGVEFWGRQTRTWSAGVQPPEGPIPVWDSTRGIMRQGGKKAGDTTGFYYAKATSVNGPSSVDDPTDDTYPRRIRVTLVVEEQTAQARKTGNVYAPVEPDARTIELTDASFIPLVDTTQQFVKIGDEWIQFEGVSGNTLTGCTRGARGTLKAAHGPGASVHYGRTIVREFPVPTYRDAYKDELPSITEFR